MAVQYRFLNALNAVEATRRPDQSRTAASGSRGRAACTRCAGSTRRPPSPGTWPRSAPRPGRSRRRPTATAGVTRRPARRPDRRRASRTCTDLAARLERGRQASRRPARPRSGRRAPRHRHGRHRRRRRRPRRPARRRARGHARCRSRCSGCSTARSWAPPATLLAGLDRALDPNGDGNLSDHARRDPGAAWPSRSPPSASIARGARRARASNASAACSSPPPATTAPTCARFGTVASPGRLAGLARRRRERRPRDRCRRSTSTLGPTASDRRRRRAAGRRARPDDATPRCRSCCPPARRVRPARAPADVAPAATRATTSRTDGTSLVNGKAVLVPRDGAPIAAARRRGRSRGRERARALRRRRRPRRRARARRPGRCPIAVLPGEQGAAAAATLLTGGAVTITFRLRARGRNPDGRLRRRRSRRRASASTTWSSPTSWRRASPITTSAPGGLYLAVSGTSVAAAQVAGVAALCTRRTPAGRRA